MKKNTRKKTFFPLNVLDHFLSKKNQIRDHFFPLLFLKDTKYLKSLDIEIGRLVIFFN